MTSIGRPRTSSMQNVDASRSGRRRDDLARPSRSPSASDAAYEASATPIVTPKPLVTAPNMTLYDASASAVPSAMAPRPTSRSYNFV